MHVQALSALLSSTVLQCSGARSHLRRLHRVVDPVHRRVGREEVCGQLLLQRPAAWEGLAALPEQGRSLVKQAAQGLLRVYAAACDTRQGG